MREARQNGAAIASPRLLRRTVLAVREHKARFVHSTIFARGRCACLVVKLPLSTFLRVLAEKWKGEVNSAKMLDHPLPLVVNRIELL